MSKGKMLKSVTTKRTIPGQLSSNTRTQPPTSNLTTKSTTTHNPTSTKLSPTTHPPTSNPHMTHHTQTSTQTTSLLTIRPIKSLKIVKERNQRIVNTTYLTMALAITLRISRGRRFCWMNSSWKGLGKIRNLLIWVIIFRPGTEIPQGQENPCLIGP